MGDNLPAKRTYDSETVERGLAELALWERNARAASRSLERQGIGIPHQTLAYWKARHAERLAEIEATKMPAIRQRMAEDAEHSAIRLAQLQRDLTEQLAEKRDDLSAKETASALQQVTTAKAIDVDKASLLRGMPTEITGHRRTDDEIYAELRKLGFVVDGTAEPLDPPSG
jgi:hypothetical protein